MINLRRRLAVLCARTVSVIIQKLSHKQGSTLPGYIARLICPDILPQMSGMIREKIIVTMGTNGKTTVNSMLYHGLIKQGKRVVINGTGANMMGGVIGAFVLAADWRGGLDADYACIEVDEFAAAQILPLLKPDYVLLTNIFRDQMDRYGEIDAVLYKIRTALAAVPEATLVINGDDFFSYTLRLRCDQPAVTYGINEKIFDKTCSPKVRESTFCRFCGEKLEFAYFQYGQIGSYACPRCSFRRPIPEFTAEHIRLESEGYAFDLNGIPIQTHTDAPYQVYNILSAYAALVAAGISPEGAAEAAGDFDYENSREEVFWIRGTRVQLYLAKNPIGFQQKIAMIAKDRTAKDIIVKINDTPQDGRDISWLWDVDFHYLKDAGAASVITAGSRRLDMELRLKYEDIPCRPAEDLREAETGLLMKGTGNLYMIVNYSGLRPANRMLHQLQAASKKTLTDK